MKKNKREPFWYDKDKAFGVSTQKHFLLCNEVIYSLVLL